MWEAWLTPPSLSLSLQTVGLHEGEAQRLWLTATHLQIENLLSPTLGVVSIAMSARPSPARRLTRVA